MSKDALTSKMDATGLRYKAKTSGSPFGMTGATGGTMSCYKCGQHKPRALGSFRRLVGKNMFVCSDCQPAPKT
mgnify:CR=1 FL=1|jgi:hypothetical protein